MRVTEEHVEARKSQILDAAWECFAELGYHQTTMAAIAAAAGLSTGALYLYFENKDALMQAIGERSREINRRVVLDARANSDDPLTALSAVGRTMLAVFSDPRFEETTRVNIEIWPELLRNETLKTNLRNDLTFWKDAVEHFLRDAQTEGEVRADVNPRAMALLLIVAWEGIRHYKLADPEFSEQVLFDAMRPLMTEKGQMIADELQASMNEVRTPGPPFGMPQRDAGGEEERGRWS
jgi:AcrR family transcriptional regulator